MNKTVHTFKNFNVNDDSQSGQNVQQQQRCGGPFSLTTVPFNQKKQLYNVALGLDCISKLLVALVAPSE